MTGITILSIIITIINIAIIIVNLLLIKKVKELNKTNNKKINIDEYFNSLEFNTLLDDKIRPLLGELSDEDIIKKVTRQVIRYDLKDIDMGIDDVDKLMHYIADVLLNYNNTYTEGQIEFETYDNDEIVDYYMNHGNKSPEEYFSEKAINRSNNIDLSGVLNNFYKD